MAPGYMVNVFNIFIQFLNGSQGMRDYGFLLQYTGHFVLSHPNVNTGWAEHNLVGFKFAYWVRNVTETRRRATDKTWCKETPKSVRIFNLWRWWLRGHVCIDNIKEIMKAIDSPYWDLLTKVENTEIKGTWKNGKRQHLLLALTLICVVRKGNLWLSLSWEVM